MRRAPLSLFLAGVLAGCGGVESADRPLPVRPAGQLKPPVFEALTRESGIDFVHFNAASPRRYLPETMGSGVAVFDLDADGLPDLYFANGTSLTGQGPVHTGRLFRNLGDWKFQDVTRGSGLDVPFFGMGTAVGDFDGDGRDDLVVTGVDQVRLFRNLGNGRFRQQADELGLDCPGFSSGAAFLDYDRDGYLDLFVIRYVDWSPERDVACSLDRVNRTYCTPEVYPGMPACLFRNVEGRRFEDVSERSGVASKLGKALGVVVFDYNRDGWPDLAVANDTVGNLLFVNQHDGTFVELGVETGMAYGESGSARGGMGIDAGDVDGDGWTDLIIGNFSHEMISYYRASPEGYFIDDAAPAGLGLPTLLTLAFGTLVEDLDNNGAMDVLVVNGHIEPDIARTQRGQTYRQAPHLFLGAGSERLELFEPGPGDPLGRPMVARGLAAGDLDRDGRLDLVITENGGPALVLRNRGDEGHWLQLRPRGTVSNRNGYGLRVEAYLRSGKLVRYLGSGRSYLSASEPVLHLGLGERDRVDRIDLFWPSGRRQVLLDVAANQVLEVVEPAESGTPDR